MTAPSDQTEIFLKERRTVFQNSKFNVFSDHILDSTGRSIEDYLVVAPKQSTGDLVTGVAILPIFQNTVVLLKSYRHAIRRTIIEAPRGFVDAGEAPRDAAIRELAEETGLVCLPDDLVSLGICSPEAGMIAARVALFAALDCQAGTRSDVDEMGLGKCVRYSLPEARALLQTMVLEDVTTALSLHRFFATGFIDENQLVATGD